MVTSMLVRKKLIQLAVIIIVLGCQALISLAADTPTSTTPSPRAKSVVVFVHGYTGSVGTWDRFANLISGDDQLDGFTVHKLQYPTSPFWYRNQPIKEIGKLLKTELLERLRGFEEIYLIGHSMGGLVICSMVVEQLKDGRAQDLKPIKHIILFGTPNNGEQIPKLFSFWDKQLGDMSSAGITVNDIRNEWINKVYNPKIASGDENFKLHIPVTIVVGLDDNIVDKSSAESFFKDPTPLTVPGGHVSMKEPEDGIKSIAYAIVKNRLLPSQVSDPSPLGESSGAPNKLLALEYAKQKGQACNTAYKEQQKAWSPRPRDTAFQLMQKNQVEYYESACNYWERLLAREEGRQPEERHLPTPEKPGNVRVNFR